MNYWDLPPSLRREVDAFRFKTQLRVRFVETDAQGVVYNGSFLTYLDVARVEYHRNLHLLESQFPNKWWDGTVAETEVDYLAPARFDDVLTIYVRCAWTRRRSLGFSHLIFNETTGHLIARATSGHVTLHPDTREPLELPEPLRERLTAFDGDRILVGDAAPRHERPRLGQGDVPDEVRRYHFKDSVRVRAAETDAQGIVYNGTFFTYLEVGRVSYIRTLLGQTVRNVAKQGFDISVAQAACQFRAPARFDEILDIHVRIARVGRSSIRFDYLILTRSSQRLVATGDTVMVWVHPETRRPIAVPEWLRERIREIEGAAAIVPPLAELEKAGA
ncbi:MAG: acyl-CoA thioesterase [Myxococcales bacterium]|nr:acyl-CoA thioesterase [Myxococcales bacterium]